MRTSLLTRSVISIASLAIGSVALAAAPATAAGPSGVTRDLVLAAADAERGPVDSNPAADTLAQIVCAPQSGETMYGKDVRTVYGSDDVDGVLVEAYYTDEIDRGYRTCSFAAFAPRSPKTTLTGTATVTGTPYDTTLRVADPAIASTPLSGDVTATEPVDGSAYYDLVATAKGDVISTASTTTSTSRTITPKTTQQRYAAKKARNSTVSSARKAYVKASKKAGASKTKRAAAKRTYLAKKKAANATYRTALEGTLTIGTTTSSTTTSSPFEITIYGGCSSFARC